MDDIKKMTEAELRESKVPWPKTEKELTDYINSLVDREHDYGTCVYAMSMAATATFYYVSSKLGVTGFQASCADMDIIRRTRSMESGFMILNYENLLYPQCCDDEHFPGWKELIAKNKEHLAKKAKEKLANGGSANENVRKHWELLAGCEL